MKWNWLKKTYYYTYKSTLRHPLNHCKYPLKNFATLSYTVIRMCTQGIQMCIKITFHLNDRHLIGAHHTTPKIPVDPRFLWKDLTGKRPGKLENTPLHNHAPKANAYVCIICTYRVYTQVHLTRVATLFIHTYVCVRVCLLALNIQLCVASMQYFHSSKLAD